jgi:hypothetical protein
MKGPNAKSEVIQVVRAGHENLLVQGKGRAILTQKKSKFRIEVPNVNGFRLLSAQTRQVNLRHWAVALCQGSLGLKHHGRRGRGLFAITELNILGIHCPKSASQKNT